MDEPFSVRAPTGSAPAAPPGKQKARVARSRPARSARHRRIKEDVRKMWGRIHERRRASDTAWADRERTVQASMYAMPLGEVVPETAPSGSRAAVVKPVTHVGQGVWIRQQRRELDKTMRRVEAECSQLTAEDILKVLPEEEVIALRERFDSAERDGERGQLTIDQFIKFMMDSLQRSRPVSPQEEYDLCQGLGELFLYIDVDGSGAIGWEEFTHYILHSYTALSNQVDEFLPYRMDRVQSRGRDPHRGAKAQFLPTLRQILCVDTGRKSTARGDTLERSTVRMFDPSNVNDSFALLEHDGIVVSACYIPERSKLALGMENSMLEYYAVRTDRAKPWPNAGMVSNLHWKLRREYEEKVRNDRIKAAKGRLRPVARAYCTETSLVLHWDALLGSNGLLFSGTRHGNMFMYDVDAQEDQQLPVVLAQMKQVHKAVDGSDGGEPVTALTTIPGIAGHRKLISTSFFGQVHMTDVEKQHIVPLRGNLHSQQHHQGVYSIDYHEDLNLLVTAGYEPDAILWMPICSANQFVARLSDSEDPHKDSLLGAHVVPGTHQIITADATGMLKMWDIRKSLCMHTWNLERGMTQLEIAAYRATNFMLDPHSDSRALYCTARTDTKESRFYTMVPTKPLQLKIGTAHDAPVIGAIYNIATNTFITAAGIEVRLWNAEQGCPAMSIPNAAAEQITALCLDKAGRRFILGMHSGAVTVHSYATGAVIQAYEGHSEEVTCCCYLEGPRFVATASLDGEVRIFNDAADPAETVSVQPPQFTLRAYGAVCSMHYSPALHLLAFGDAREVLHVWDFHTRLYCHPQAKCVRKGLGEGYLVQSMALTRGGEQSPQSVAAASPDLGDPSLEGDPGPDTHAEINFVTDRCLENYMNPKASEIHCLVFMTPLAAVVSADATGHLGLWSVRPYHWPYEMFAQWKTKASLACTNRQIVPVVTAMDWCLEADSSIAAGDDHGSVTIWDMRDVISHLDLVPTSFPPPWTARRKDERKPEPFRKKPTLKLHWAVSPEPITGVCIVPSADTLVVSSTNTQVSLWSLGGKPLGKLCQGRKLTDPTPPDYHFHSSVAAAMLEEGDDMLDQVVERTLMHRRSQGALQDCFQGDEAPKDSDDDSSDPGTDQPTSPRPVLSPTLGLAGFGGRRGSSRLSFGGRRRSHRLQPFTSAQSLLSGGAAGQGSPVARIAAVTSIPEVPVQAAAQPAEVQLSQQEAPAAQRPSFSSSASGTVQQKPRVVTRFVISVVDDVACRLGRDFMVDHDTYTPPETPPVLPSVRNSPARPSAAQPRFVTPLGNTERAAANSLVTDSPSRGGSPTRRGIPSRVCAASAAHPIWQGVDDRDRQLEAAERETSRLCGDTVAQVQSALWQVWRSTMEGYLRGERERLPPEEAAALQAEVLPAALHDAATSSRRGIIFGRRPLKSYASANVSAALLASLQADPSSRSGVRDPLDGKLLAAAPQWVRDAVNGFRPHTIETPVAELLAGGPPIGARHPGEDSSLGSADECDSADQSPPPHQTPATVPLTEVPGVPPAASTDEVGRQSQATASTQPVAPAAAASPPRPAPSQPRPGHCGSEFAQMAEAAPGSLAALLTTSPRSARTPSPPKSAPAPAPAPEQADFARLLQVSAPRYPIDESPYLSVGNAPALNPLQYPTAYQSRRPAEAVPPEMRLSRVPRGRRAKNDAAAGAACTGALAAAAAAAVLREAALQSQVGALLTAAGAVGVIRSDPLRAFRYPAPDPQELPTVAVDSASVLPAPAPASPPPPLMAVMPITKVESEVSMQCSFGAASSAVTPSKEVADAVSRQVVEIEFGGDRGRACTFAAGDGQLLLSLGAAGAARRTLGRVAALRWDGRLLVDLVIPPGAPPTPAWPVDVSMQEVQDKAQLRRLVSAAAALAIPHQQVQEVVSDIREEQEASMVTDRRSWMSAQTCGHWIATRGDSAEREKDSRAARRIAAPGGLAPTELDADSQGLMRSGESMLELGGGLAELYSPKFSDSLTFSGQLALPESLEEVAVAVTHKVRQGRAMRRGTWLDTALVRAAPRGAALRRPQSATAGRPQRAEYAAVKPYSRCQALMQRAKPLPPRTEMALVAQAGGSPVVSRAKSKEAAVTPGNTARGPASELFATVLDRSEPGEHGLAPQEPGGEELLRAARFTGLGYPGQRMVRPRSAPPRPAAQGRAAGIGVSMTGTPEQREDVLLWAAHAQRVRDQKPCTEGHYLAFSTACHFSPAAGSPVAPAPEDASAIRLGPVGQSATEGRAVGRMPPSGAASRKRDTALLRQYAPADGAQASPSPMQTAVDQQGDLSLEAYLRKVEDGPVESLSITTQKVTTAGDSQALRVGVVCTRSTTVRRKQTRTIHAVGLGKELRPEWIPALKALDAANVLAAERATEKHSSPGKLPAQAVQIPRTAPTERSLGGLLQVQQPDRVPVVRSGGFSFVQRQRPQTASRTRQSGPPAAPRPRPSSASAGRGRPAAPPSGRGDAGPGPWESAPADDARCFPAVEVGSPLSKSPQVNIGLLS
eukprot:TRINITY_DN4752_c2_g2_i6.p1 TRINITY_DN4752_c2_g2~~TRINITY_DN4752_c2_g2_i6.p1  ORF type:complete len:2533 (+),score=626.85 TRINITY_DN4752_c2_g2_i6:75-7601(+)